MNRRRNRYRLCPVKDDKALPDTLPVPGDVIEDADGYYWMVRFVYSDKGIAWCYRGRFHLLGLKSFRLDRIYITSVD